LPSTPWQAAQLADLVLPASASPEDSGSVAALTCKNIMEASKDIVIAREFFISELLL
jgi:hypothetical protein